MVGRDGSNNGSVMRQALPIYYALLLAILTYIAIQLVFRLEHVVLILFISVLIAATVSRPAAQLERLRIPRFLAALIVYVIAFAVMFVTAWYVLPPLFGQIAEFSGNVPEYVERWEGLQETYARLQDQYPSLGAFDSQVEGAAGRIASWAGQWLASLPQVVFSAVYDALSVFFISLLIVTARQRILELILSLVSPDHRETTRNVLTKMWERLGYYLQAKLIVMAIVGVLMYAALYFIGVDFPVLLAILAALGQLIPRIGPWLARIPLIGIAAFDGLTTVILVMAASILIENLKGYVISPVIEGEQLDMHPLLVFIAVLVGGALFGVVGAIVSVPAAAMLQVLFEEVIYPWRQRQIGEAPVVSTVSERPEQPTA